MAVKKLDCGAGAPVGTDRWAVRECLVITARPAVAPYPQIPLLDGGRGFTPRHSGNAYLPSRHLFLSLDSHGGSEGGVIRASIDRPPVGASLLAIHLASRASSLPQPDRPSNTAFAHPPLRVGALFAMINLPRNFPAEIFSARSFHHAHGISRQENICAFRAPRAKCVFQRRNHHSGTNLFPTGPNTPRSFRCPPKK